MERQVDWQGRMIDFLLGFNVYAIVFLLAVGLSNRQTRMPYLTFVVLSFLLGVVQAYAMNLPQGGGDARSFMRAARVWSAGGLNSALDYYTGPHGYFISWIHSLIFALTGPSNLMPNAFSTLFTFIAIHTCIKISIEAWGQWATGRVAWFVCLFPTVLLHSAVMLREAYVMAFFAIGILYVLRWRKTMSPVYFIFAHIAFAGAIFFHGAMVIANIALMLYAVSMTARALLATLVQRRNFLPYFALLVVFSGSFVALAGSGISLPKIGNISEFFSPDTAAESVFDRGGADTARGTAAHPSWTLVNNDAQILPKLPIRFVYFTFSPFPWDIRSPYHLIGLIDSFLYLSMFFVMYIHEPTARNCGNSLKM